MSMTCDKIQSLLPLAVDGELDESARGEVRRHVKDCEPCRRAHEFQSRLRLAIQRAPLGAPPPVYFEGVLAEIHRKMPAVRPMVQPRRRRLTPQRFASLAMAALMMLWLGAGIMPLLPNQGFSSNPRHGQPLRSYAAAANLADRPKLVAVKNWGLVTFDAEIWRMTPGQLADLGFSQQAIESIALEALKRG